MKVKAICSFAGAVCMMAGEVADVPEEIAAPLLRCGYLQAAESAAQDEANPAEQTGTKSRMPRAKQKGDT